MRAIHILLGVVICCWLPASAVERWTNTLNMQFIAVPAGEFIMGSPDSEKDRSPNETPHRVRISRSFRLSATHVTVSQFAAFAKDSGYQTAAEKEGWAYGAWNTPSNRWDRIEGGSWKNPGFKQSDQHPVVSVNWHDATAFCRWLSVKEARQYRLPTEAEWEYACRAGTATAFFWGDNPDDGQDRANGSDRTSGDRFTIFPPFTWSDGFVYTSPVGTFRPNAWGLHDMIGNTLQWCADWFGDYPAAEVNDPSGPADGKERILRGGGFVYGPARSRCAFRGRNSPDFRNFYIGFRVLLAESSAQKPPTNLP
jgi:formylglycine-generating enzyme required for sulfatase activity